MTCLTRATNRDNCHYWYMSMDFATDRRFTMDKADRMRKALRESGVGVQEIADRLQVSRNAVSTWINGRHEPRPRDLRAFALATGYPLHWLETGEAPTQGPGSGLRKLPGLDSNQEPAG